MADAGERRGRDGGEMEARRGRDGGGDATRVAATRVARAARLVTNTNPNTNQSAEPRLYFSRRSQSEHPALKVSRRTCGAVRRHHWRVVRRPASAPTRLRALADGALRSRPRLSPASAISPPPPSASRLQLASVCVSPPARLRLRLASSSPPARLRLASVSPPSRLHLASPMCGK